MLLIACHLSTQLLLFQTTVNDETSKRCLNSHWGLMRFSRSFSGRDPCVIHRLQGVTCSVDLPVWIEWSLHIFCTSFTLGRIVLLRHSTTSLLWYLFFCRKISQLSGYVFVYIFSTFHSNYFVAKWVDQFPTITLCFRVKISPQNDDTTLNCTYTVHSIKSIWLTRQLISTPAKTRTWTTSDTLMIRSSRAFLMCIFAPMIELLPRLASRKSRRYS